MRPVPGEPVKQIMSTPERTRAAPIAPSPWMTWTTSVGRPASWARSATRLPVNGVSSDGFRTTEHPADIAGNAPSIATKNGALYGEITAATPRGLYSIQLRTIRYGHAGPRRGRNSFSALRV